MKDNLENIDQLFKDSLSNYKEVPPAHLWNAVQAKSSIGSSQAASKLVVKKGLSVVSKWMFASISVAAIGTTAFLFTKNSEVENFKQNAQIVKSIDVPSSGSLDSQNTELIPQKNQNQFSKSNQSEPINPTVIEGISNSNRLETNSSEVGGSVKHETQKVNQDIIAKQPVNQTSELNIEKVETQPLTSIALKHSWKIETADVAENAKMFTVVANFKLASAVFYFGDGKSDKLIEQQNPFVSHEYFVANTKVFKTKVVLKFADGQKDSQYVNVSVNPIQPAGEVLVPDVFTPNGDGRNDKYLVYLPKPESFEMMIMDLNNRQIFNTLNIFEGWDGRCGKEPCASGEYRVILKTKYSGEPEKVSHKKILLKTNLN